MRIVRFQILILFATGDVMYKQETEIDAHILFSRHIHFDS
jgi:hypothetical protein